MAKAVKTIYIRTPEGKRHVIHTGDEVPDELLELDGVNLKAFGLSEGGDPTPDTSDDEPLLKRSKDDLLEGAKEWGAEGVTERSTKAEIAEAIRAAGYEDDDKLLESDED